MSLKDAIKAEANQLGFVLFGVAPSASPPHYPAYQAWIRASRQAGMAYLARPEALTSRSTPEQLLPGCRSILCVGLPYPPPLPSPAAEPEKVRGRIAAYATLPDYHTILASKLEALAVRLPSLTGRNVHWRACVDTAPILEKDFAFLAGLGWIGRNSYCSPQSLARMSSLASCSPIWRWNLTSRYKATPVPSVINACKPAPRERCS